MIGVTLEREIGIDVERIRTQFDIEGIARRFFSPDEVERLFKLDVDLQRTAFFLCWTRKEAYIKAKGGGLSIPLDQFDVSLAPGEPAALLHARDDPQEVQDWSIYHLDPGDGYVAALAVQGQLSYLRGWDWSLSAIESG